MQGRQGKSCEGKAEQGKARECPETVGKAEAEEGQSSDGRGARESSARKCQGGKGQQVRGGNGSTRQCKARTEGLDRQGKAKERKARHGEAWEERSTQVKAGGGCERRFGGREG